MPHHKPAANWPTGLMILQGNRLEDLRDIMTEWLRRHPLAPLEQEQLLVQSNGIAQWLKLALAADVAPNGGGCGVAASLQIDLPGRFIWRLWRLLFAQLPTQSPFDKVPLSWRLYRLLSEHFPDLATQPPTDPDAPLQRLHHFLQHDRNDPAGRRYQLAEQLADLFDQYQVYRSDWLQAWEQGDDRLPVADQPLAAAQPIPHHQRWQPLLWRLVSADIATDQQRNGGDNRSRATIHRDFIEACQRDPAAVAARLPRRVILFGITSLPQQSVELLRAIAPFTQVLIFLLNPCQHFWGDLVEGRELLRNHIWRTPLRRTGADDRPLFQALPSELLHLHGNPLLAAWGKQGRDYIHLLQEHDQHEAYAAHFTRIDLFSEPDESTLLRQIQSDILDLRPLNERRLLNGLDDAESSAADPPPLDADDSIRFITTYTPQREIETLHDQLLDAFEQARQQGDPLQPRDILVMVPDIQHYAPHIEAVFGRYRSITPAQAHDTRYLRYHIADQGLRQRNPLLLALERLLQLPDARFSVSDILTLLEVPALRQRFGIEASQLPLLLRWIEGSNIRWGLHTEQRQQRLQPPAAQQPIGEQNSWRFGLRRMLLGYANGDSDAWQSVAPYDEVAGLQATIAGALALLLDQLEESWSQLQQPRSAAAWVTYLQQMLDDYFLPISGADDQALGAVERQLDTWLLQVEAAALTEQPLPLSVVRDALLTQLDQPSLSQRFLAGAINFATLMPMRAIPFRHVYLLGMSDDAFPRRTQRADFDLMAEQYRPGDRSRRDDDRYLFLEALLSARDRLVISWLGRSAHDNSEQPPALPVAQLRDYLAQGWHPNLPQQLTYHYPLQPFSRRYFSEDEPAYLFTYAKEWDPSHTAPPTPAAPQTLPAWQPEQGVTQRQLYEFLRVPAAALFQQRLDIAPATEATARLEVENFNHDSLQRWRYQDQLINRLLREALLSSGAAQGERSDMTQLKQQISGALQRLQREGELIDGALGELQGEELCETMAGLAEQCAELLTEQHQLPLADQPRHLHWQPTAADEQALPAIQWDIEPLYRHRADPNQLLQPRLQSRSGLKKGKKPDPQWHNLLEGWLQHIAATIAVAQHPTLDPAATLTTVLLTPTGAINFKPLTHIEATTYLQQLLAIWLEGMQRPLPITLTTAIAYLNSSANATASATKQFDEIAKAYPDELTDQRRGYALRHCFSDVDQLLQRRCATDSPPAWWRLGSASFRQQIEATPPLAAEVAEFQLLALALYQPLHTGWALPYR